MRPLKIRDRLVVLLLAVWLPAAVGFGILAAGTYQREAASAREQIEQLAGGINFVVERELDTRAALAQAFGATTAAREGDVTRFHREASAAVNGTPNWAVLVDKDQQFANTRVPLAQTQPLPRTESAPLARREPLIWFARQGTVQPTPVITVYSPAGPPEDTRFNVGIVFEPTVLQNILTQHAIPGHILGTIMDNRLHVMARTRDPAKWLDKSASAPLADEARAGRSGFFDSTTLDGVDSLTYLTAPNRYGWSVVISYPKSELDAALRRATRHALMAAAMLLLISFALAWFAARGIARPVRALGDAAARVGADTLPPVLETGIVEVNQVAAALREASLKSHEATQLLEQRVARAVEEARNAQAKLLDGQKHEAIGRLTGGVAHDFNNLLQTITTAHHVLARQVHEGPARRMLDGAMRATARGADLIRQLLAFGRTQPLQPQVVRLDDVLLHNQELTSKAVGERVVLTASIAPHLPALFVDPVQLELAVLNLIFNARDAMGERGGCIVVSGRMATREETRELGSGRFVCVAVTDDGPGMSPDTLARAFEPYFTTKAIGAGSGLGLAQAKAFAIASGGCATLVSAEGAGTTASLVLPASEAVPGITRVAEPMPQPRRNLAILMVEDDVLVASVVVSVLENEGHRVVLCGSADEALARLQAETETTAFDVLFTDIVMPGHTSGLDLAAWCAAHRPGLPVVLATGYSAQPSEFDPFILRKPFRVDDLMAALDKAVGSARSAPPLPAV